MYEALTKAGRQDLIGFEKHCLIKPRKFGGEKAGAWSKSGSGSKTSANKSGYGKKSDGNGNFNSGKSQATEKKGKKKTIRNVHNKKKK